MREWETWEEIALYRSLCRFKPVGQNKHFHMISILSELNNKRPDTEIIKSDDVWEKLKTLYDLEGLDKIEESEDESDEEEEEEEEDEDKREDTVKPFDLPYDQFGAIMVEKAKDGKKSETSTPEPRSSDKSDVKNEEDESQEGEEEEENDVNEKDDSGTEETDAESSKSRKVKEEDEGEEEEEHDEEEDEEDEEEEEDNSDVKNETEDEESERNENGDQGGDESSEGEEGEEGDENSDEEEEGDEETTKTRRRTRTQAKEPAAKRRKINSSPEGGRRLRTRAHDNDKQEVASKPGRKKGKPAQTTVNTPSKVIKTRAKSQPRRSTRRK